MTSERKGKHAECLHLSVAARVIDDQQSAGGIHELAGARMSGERCAVHRGGTDDALEGDLAYEARQRGKKTSENKTFAIF